MKDELKIGALLDCANSVDGTEGPIAKVLYERTIDWGAHPNERALTQMLSMHEKTEHVEFKIAYLEGKSDQLKFALKTTAQVGVCTLLLFRAVYPERFDILGITDALRHMKKGL